MRNKNTNKNREHLLKNAIPYIGYSVPVSAHFLTKSISNVLYVSTNKYLISFQNCFGDLSRFRRGKKIEISLISNVSSIGNTTPCHGQHVAHELLVKTAWSRHYTSLTTFLYVNYITQQFHHQRLKGIAPPEFCIHLSPLVQGAC
jgi:hypothetical protein